MQPTTNTPAPTAASAVQPKTNTLDVRAFAIEQYNRFYDAIAEGDQLVQNDAIREMEGVLKKIEKKYKKASIYGEIVATLARMRSKYAAQQNTIQQRKFHVAKNYGNGRRRQDIQSRITKRRLQHHTPLNETLRYGYKNTTKRYMRNYENEY